MKRPKRVEALARPAAGSVDRPAARELAVLATVLLIGVLLRAEALSHSAVEHFDEGVYSSNIFCAPPDYAWPMQHLYAPPLLPTLIEAGMILGLPMNLAALLPSFVAGCATIGVLWWLGRSWFGPRVGVAAAVLAALSDLHIAYSAAALTDVLLGLWLLVAIHFLARSLLLATRTAPPAPRDRRRGSSARRYDLAWGVAAGLFTGAAWWTKYNGWLPLAIGAAAVAMLAAFLRPDTRRLARWLASLGLAACVATIVWSAYLHSLQDRGGYGPIAANHAKYIVGLEGWPASLLRHTVSQSLIEGLPGMLSVGVALVAAFAVATPRNLTGRTSAVWWRSAAAVWLFAGALVLSAWFGASFSIVVALAPLGCLVLLAAIRQAPPSDSARLEQAIPAAMLAAWWGGLLVMTPCYTPYPRLLFPWLFASWLGAAVWLDRAVLALLADSALPAAVCPPTRRWLIAGGLAVILATLATVAAQPASPVARPGADRRELVRIARQMRIDATDAIPSTNAEGPAPRAICVFGEPALLFQLKAAREHAALVVEDVPPSEAVVYGQEVPTLLAIGPHARADRRFQEQWSRQKHQWQHVADYQYEPSRVVWFDLFDPVSFDSARHQQFNHFGLYQLKAR